MLGLFEKIQSGEKLSAEEKEFARVKKRFEKLCEVAANEVPLYVDAERSWRHNRLMRW